MYISPMLMYFILITEVGALVIQKEWNGMYTYMNPKPPNPEYICIAI